MKIMGNPTTGIQIIAFRDRLFQTFWVFILESKTVPMMYIM